MNLRALTNAKVFSFACLTAGIGLIATGVYHFVRQSKTSGTCKIVVVAIAVMWGGHALYTAARRRWNWRRRIRRRLSLERR